MIRFLSIENLAVVEQLEIELQPGLVVLTGETGAGKSVILGALDLLCGGRSAADLVRTGAQKARVQAMVEDGGGVEVALRRDVTTQGRSRAFIDDALSTVGALQERGRQLVDLHGQHEHQALLDPGTHLGLLDAFGERMGKLSHVEEAAKAYLSWQGAHHRLVTLRAQSSDSGEREAVLSFQRDEIDKVSPEEGEDEALSARRAKLANAERLARLSGDAYRTLYDADDSVLSRLSRVWRHIEELGDLDPEGLAPYTSVRSEVESRLEDLAFFLRTYASQLEASPDELERVEARLSDLEHLKRRYGPTLDDVIAHATQVRSELDGLDNADAELETLTRQEGVTRTAYLAAARSLGRSRRRVAKLLSAEVQTVLHDVGIPKATFQVRFDESDVETAWTAKGIDRVEFYLSANPGESPRPLAKVASGGELSRVMLALKTLATVDVPGKTLVFDEVDAGIGGVVADRVGRMLRALSEKYQVICVTHLPQIAAYGTSHYTVQKTVTGSRTMVDVDLVEGERRVSEIARLMTGRASAKAIAGAEELLAQKQRANTPGESESRRRKRKAKVGG